MLRLKKNSYKEFDNEKKILPLENSPPLPHNFFNGASLKTLSHLRWGNLVNFVYNVIL